MDSITSCSRHHRVYLGFWDDCGFILSSSAFLLVHSVFVVRFFLVSLDIPIYIPSFLFFLEKKRKNGNKLLEGGFFPCPFCGVCGRLKYLSILIWDMRDLQLFWGHFYCLFRPFVANVPLGPFQMQFFLLSFSCTAGEEKIKIGYRKTKRYLAGGVFLRK